MVLSPISENEVRTNVVKDTLSYALANAARLRAKEKEKKVHREPDLLQVPPSLHDPPKWHHQSLKSGVRPRAVLKYPEFPPFIPSKLPNLVRHDTSAVSLIANFHESVRRADRPGSWDAYQEIVTTHPMGSTLLQPDLLHGLAMLLAKARPKTRETFLRLLAVISELRNMREEVHLWEWNALIHLAGSGFRKAELEDFNAAFKIMEDMQHQHSEAADGDEPMFTAPAAPNANLDIWTLNSLLDVAIQTRSEGLVKRALSLFNTHRIEPDRITHITLIKHHAETGALDLIPPIIDTMLRADINPGIDGINSVLWAYGRAGRLNDALAIYHAMRRPPLSKLPSDVLDSHPILSITGIEKALGKGPDGITFRCLIQCLAYHGDLINSIEVFRDMLTTPRSRKYREIVQLEDAGDDLQTYNPRADVFRTLFIGFTRHGVAPVQTAVDRILSYGFANPGVPWSSRSSKEIASSRRKTKYGRRQITPIRSTTAPVTQSIGNPPACAWTLENLHPIFASFLDIRRPDISPPPSGSFPVPKPPVNPDVIYWCLAAYARTSHNDREIMRVVWLEISRTFGFVVHETSEAELGEEPPMGWEVKGRLKALVKWVEDGKEKLE